jgi:hypothetical protein
MSKVYLNILTTGDITAAETGRRIATIIQESTPDIFPDRIGNWEPIANPCFSPEDFVRFWSWPVLAKRRKPKSHVSVFFRKPHRKYSAIYIGIESSTRVTSDLSQLLAKIAILTEAEFGMIQTVTESYRERADARRLLQYIDKQKTRFFMSLYDESIAHGLPDAFDVMWLPEGTWIVNSTDLIRTSTGVYTLRSGDSDVRDDVLRGVQKRANKIAGDEQPLSASVFTRLDL